MHSVVSGMAVKIFIPASRSGIIRGYEAVIPKLMAISNRLTLKESGEVSIKTYLKQEVG